MGRKDVIMADEPIKVEIIGRVDTNYPDSYRVKEDYEKEQKEARERHAMLQEQHRVLLRSYQANLVLAAATVLVAVATCALVFLTYRTTGYKPTSTTQSQQQPLQPQQSPPVK
jgi:hypothetical protein